MTTFLVLVGGVGWVLFLALTAYGVFCEGRRAYRDWSVKRYCRQAAREWEHLE